MNFSEKEIQDHIWEQRENWHDLILPLKLTNPYSFEDEDSIYGLSADKLLYNLTYERISELYASVKNLELIGVEVPLEKKKDSTIRADFLGVEPGAPGIAIIELKKSTQTEREAFTEMLAYASHINNLFPTHCLDDNILILIAPFKVRTVREAFLQSLIFDRKRVFVLQPVFEDKTNIKTLRLKPYTPNPQDISSLTEVAFAKRNFDVEVAVWIDTPEFWNTTKEKRDPSHNQRENMNRVSAYAAQLMESKKIHGFVYTQQCWPELVEMLPYSNSLVMVGFNPYKIANDKYYADHNPKIKISEIPEINDYGPNLADLIPGLNKSAKKLHADTNFMVDLNMVWDSHLGRIANEVVKTMNLNNQNMAIYRDRGSMNWHQYETSMIENVLCFNYDVRPTGILRELFWETTKIDYTHWKKFNKHPVQGDIYGWAVETLNSHHFFSEFLERMFGDPFGIRDIDDDLDEKE
ncbi:hypothetical protein [Owenweeksia hongkongensis]|uniref:hypothetical protein n=1 Tax=Owenweeksia hongkongensis TaxID=253245 RepID=UPI003A8D2BEE